MPNKNTGMALRLSAGRAAIMCSAIALLTSCGGRTAEPFAAGQAPGQVVRSAYVFNVLHAFRGYTGGASNGSPPVNVKGALYGVASGGTGPCQCGIVYRVQTVGSAHKFDHIYEFQGQYYGPRSDGADPVALVVGTHGEFYGITDSGGSAGSGTVFRLSPSGTRYTESVVYSFPGGAQGGRPTALTWFHGALYGTTSIGGPNAFGGTVFELSQPDTAPSERVLYQFQGGSNGNSDGAIPTALLIDRKGNMYGITQIGGGKGLTYCSQGCGTVFRLTPRSGGYDETILHAFAGGSDGGTPVALVLGATGTLYGTTSAGYGTVFALVPRASRYKKELLYTFPGGTGGWGPAGLTLDRSGNLYGTLQNAGINSAVCPSDYGCGTIFELQLTGSTYSESTLYQFTGGKDGAAPGGLIDSGNGTLYGVAFAGGHVTCTGGAVLVAGCGTVFELTP